MDGVEDFFSLDRMSDSSSLAMVFKREVGR